MDRRSQLMALAVAFVVAAAALPATARADDSCRTAPSGAARAGKHWYYQTDQDTQQKCWFLGARNIAATRAGLRSFFDAMDQAQPAAETTAATCAIAPDGRAPRGKRWSYQIDSMTGRKCWHLSSRIIRTVKAAPAHTPPPLATTVEPVRPLPPPIADAQASMQEENVPASVPVADITPVPSTQTASSVSAPAQPAIHEDPPGPSFESRWPNDFGLFAADRAAPGRPGNPAIDRSAPGRATGLWRHAAQMLAAGPPLVDMLVVIVATLGSVVILLGFLDWSALFRAPASPTPQHRSPLKLPQLDAENDALTTLRPGRDDVVSLFAPTAGAVTGFGFASRFLVETV